MYKLSEIAKITDGKLHGNGNQTIEHLLFDSRSHISSANSLFFAIRTKTGDGHKYIEQVKNKGVCNFVVNEDFEIPENLQNCNFINVKNTVEALQKLASHHRQQFDIPVIGITGSNGKTIVKEWLAELLNRFAPALQSPKSYNSQIGVPLSVWQLNENYDYAIFEAGISMPGEMEKLEKIIRPNIGILTNIGDAHQENFTSEEQKILEKIKLFKNSRTIIYSPDYKEVNKILNKIYPAKNKFTFSLEQEADLQVIRRKAQNGSCLISVKYKGKIFDIKLNFKELPLIEDAIAVLSASLVIFPEKNPYDFDLSSLRPIEMRLQQMQAKNKCTVINDSYSCDLASLGMALDVLNAQNQHKKKTLVLSDIFQVGEHGEKLYRKVAELINSNNVQKLIGVGEEICQYSDFFETEKYFFKTTEQLLQNLNKLQFFDEAILIKGARKFHFEEISKRLEQKIHRTILEIDMSAFEHNLQYFKNLLNADTKIMVMVKAFSYGNGSFEIANFLQRKNIDYLAVAIADEGIELRKAGIKTPILILNPDVANFDVFVDYQLEPEIYSFRMLQEFYNAVKNRVLSPYPVHIKINTGMNRVGFDAEEIEKLAETLKRMPKIFVKSVFSHLAGSDEEKFDNFTLIQVSIFQKVTQILEQKTDYKFLKHILNSAGIERFPQYQFDMVRLGIGLYGISSNNANLLHISTLKTQIIQIREIEAGESVGYSRAWTAKRKSRIATIPIGYADGLNRLLSNENGEVIVNGKRVKIVGNICMDLTMIDITDIEANEGDEVIIFNNKLTISELAEKLNTIPYEILTSISQRVKRIYIWN